MNQRMKKLLNSNQRNLARMNSILGQRTSTKISPFSGRNTVSKRRCHANILWMHRYALRISTTYWKWSSMFSQTKTNWWRVSKWITTVIQLLIAWRDSSVKRRNIRRKMLSWNFSISKRSSPVLRKYLSLMHTKSAVASQGTANTLLFSEERSIFCRSTKLRKEKTVLNGSWTKLPMRTVSCSTQNITC